MPDRAPSPLVRASIAALLLLLGYALCIAARAGLADVYAEPAKSYLQTKRDASEVLTRDEWQALYGSLTRALTLAPGDPDNLSELGRLHRILLEADDLDAAEISRYGDAGAGYYQAALALRPTWPWDWGNLALVKYQQYQDTSGVYQNALVRAVAGRRQLVGPESGRCPGGADRRRPRARTRCPVVFREVRREGTMAAVVHPRRRLLRLYQAPLRGARPDVVTANRGLARRRIDRTGRDDHSQPAHRAVCAWGRAS